MRTGMAHGGCSVAYRIGFDSRSSHQRKQVTSCSKKYVHTLDVMLSYQQGRRTVTSTNAPTTMRYAARLTTSMMLSITRKSGGNFSRRLCSNIMGYACTRTLSSISCGQQAQCTTLLRCGTITPGVLTGAT